MHPNYQGRSPFFVACQRRNLDILRIFEEWKTQAIMVQDFLGENMLFVCAREGDVEIFNWFGGSNNFYRARGQQNYKGHTVEYVVCIAGKTGIVEEIRPKLDTKDYYGNLPLHYTIANDDEQMVRKYFTNGKAYFDLRNFKYETIFHTAAKHNSEASMRALLGRSVFLDALVRRDFKGDTPLHTAAKAGSLQILEMYLTAATPAFLELQNDFGLTPLQSVKEKISLIYEKIADLNTRKKELAA
jgi:ankyrin repeat protein